MREGRPPNVFGGKAIFHFLPSSSEASPRRKKTALFSDRARSGKSSRPNKYIILFNILLLFSVFCCCWVGFADSLFESLCEINDKSTKTEGDDEENFKFV